MCQSRLDTEVLVGNRTLAPVPADGTVHALISRAAEEHPKATALLDARSGGRISYAALELRTNHLAAQLRAMHATGLVGLLFERSVEMVIAILGTLKSGAAYLPILPSYPAQRVKEMLEEAGVWICLLQTSDFAGGLPLSCERRFTLSAEGALASCVAAPPASSTSEAPDLCTDSSSVTSGSDTAHDDPPNTLCYVMYTSGSTGRPKGVMVEHGPLLQRLAWLQEAFPLGPGDVVPCKTEYIFGVSEWEIFGTLARAATLALLPDETVRQPAAFVRALAELRATVVFLVPSHLKLTLAALERVSSVQPIAAPAARRTPARTVE